MMCSLGDGLGFDGESLASRHSGAMGVRLRTEITIGFHLSTSRCCPPDAGLCTRLLAQSSVAYMSATTSHFRCLIPSMLIRRTTSRALAALAFGLIQIAPAQAEIQHVIAISVDGLRGDFLQTFVDTAPAEFPNFVRLRNSGASTYHARCDYDFSETVPNHISMITGRPVSQPVGFADTWHHGVTSNS